MIKGDTVKDVLEYVEFDADTLVGNLRKDVELALRLGNSATNESAACCSLRDGSTRVYVPGRSGTQEPLTESLITNP